MKIPVCLALIPFLAGITLAQKTSTDSQTKPASTEMQTQSLKGTLVDASCAGPAAASQSPAKESGAMEGKSKKQKATRAAGGQGCTVSANTTQFALELSDGRTVKFDAVGNQRAQEAFKNKKKWSDEASAGKAVHAKVSGVLNGDQMMVVSID